MLILELQHFSIPNSKNCKNLASLKFQNSDDVIRSLSYSHSICKLQHECFFQYGIHLIGIEMKET